ncbi:MAG: PspC domain-containing protein [Bacteroidales bacterium]|nr:PspC domain-containing protein [Bacteroidales bacterium]
MKKTENISLAGYSFTIEVDAYVELEKYLNDIRTVFAADENAEEIVSDIEERIAELLSEKCRNGMVVKSDMIEAIKEQIGDPMAMAEEEAEAGSEKKVEKDTKPQTIRKKIYRNVDERVFGGVCSGLGAYFGIDKVFVRIIFLLIFFLTFISNVDHGGNPWFMLTILAYIALWIAMPAARTVEQKCEMKGKPMKLEGWKDFDLKTEINETAASPFARTILRLGGVFLGLLLLLCGFASLLGGIVLPAMPEILSNCKEMIIEECGPISETGEQFIHMLTIESTFWMILATAAILMGIWFVYNGIMLTFNLKAPKWRPGLVLLIAYIFSLMALATWTVKTIAEFLPTITL